MHKPLLLLALLAPACGASGDLTISTLSLSPATISTGTMTNVLATFEADGVYEQVHYRLLAPNRDVLSEDSFDTDSPNYEDPDGLMLPMSIPNAARYTFELWVSEGATESNHLEAFLTAQ